MQGKKSLLYFLGKVIYLVSLWAMIPLIVRMTDYTYTGIFSLAITVCNLFYTISATGLRSFLITDINREYSNKQYMLACAISIIAGLFPCLLFVVVTDYSEIQRTVIILFMIYKSLEAFSELCYGYYQNHGDRFVDICISLTVKGIVQLGAFYAGLAIFNDLRHAVLLMIISIIAVVAIYDFPRIRKNVRPFVMFTFFDWKRAFNLLKRCSPMIIVSLTAPLMQAIPRLHFEERFSTELFGIFSSVAAPAIIIVVFISSALVPYMPRYAKFINNNDSKGLMKLLFMSVGITLALGGVSLITAFFAGEWALVVLYGEYIRPWAWVLYSIIAATTLTAVLTCFTTLFIAARKMISLAIFSLFGCIICYITTPYLVSLFEMDGISLAMIIGQGFSIIVLVILVVKMGYKMHLNTQMR